MVFEGATQGIIVTIITAALSGLVFLLIVIAKRLYRSGDFSVTCRRHAFLHADDLHFDLSFENITDKERVFSHFEIHGSKGDVEQKIAVLEGMPFAQEKDSSFIQKAGDSYRVVLAPNSQHKICLSFVVCKGIELTSYEHYYLTIQEDNKVLKAAFDHMESTERSELVFHRKRN